MIARTPESERPRERCLSNGASTLSLRECLAILIGSGPKGQGSLGTADLLLNRPGTGMTEREQENAFFLAMEGGGLPYFSEIRGVGDACRAKVLAAFEIARRYHRFRSQSSRRKYRVSGDFLMEQALRQIPELLRALPQEWLGFVPIHRSGKVGDFCLVERGTRTHVNIDPLELFARLLALRPQAFCLFHNHPSEHLTPSSADIDLTRKVLALSSQLGIRLLGHGIVSTRGEQWIMI